MKHCSQGSSTRVKNANTGNYTLISPTQIQKKISTLVSLLKRNNLHKEACERHNNKRKRNRIDEEDNHSQMMTTNYVTKAQLNI
jgi:hypothetical protein